MLAPQLGRGYVVLIPGPAAFGKQVFALALSEAGTVTKLQYDKSTGLTQVLGAANAFAGAAITTDAEETARLNEEAAENRSPGENREMPGRCDTVLVGCCATWRWTARMSARR